MPVRVRTRPSGDAAPRTPSPYRRRDGDLPSIQHDDSFREVIKKLSLYITDVIVLPSTFEQLRTTSAGDGLRVLVEHLSRECTNPAIVNALLALKWHYGSAHEDKGLNESRASSCEIIAWRFLTHLSERDAVDFCLYEIPDIKTTHYRTLDAEQGQSNNDHTNGEADESTALLSRVWARTTDSAREFVHAHGSSKRYQLMQAISRLTISMTSEDEEEDEEDDPTTPFMHLNALEIAAIADAKRFLSQTVVQKIITGIWNGDIIFWDSLSIHATKKPTFYNPKTADPFSRLRVPKYLKAFEVLFFCIFLFLYYAVLTERNAYRISTLEILLYVWFAAFLYDEVSEWIDAGSIFYAADVWNLFDMAMIGIGIVFASMRIVGLHNNDDYILDLAFDVLSLEALFMVPRVCSILSLSPYWGTLIPCLKEMGKDFLKFMVLVIILYLGFLTTFSLIGRDAFTLSQMTLILTKIFFGSAYLGIDLMADIDKVFGPPLMLIFIMLSSILLMGSLTGMLSNSFSRVMSHAREEYLYVYSVYVLEASTSNRLTHFYPPFNLLALVIFRPLRLILPSNNKFRAARILLLKVTHVPIVAVIQLYELIRNRIVQRDGGFKGRQHDTIAGTPKRATSSATAATRPFMHSRPSSSYQPGYSGNSRPHALSDAATAAAASRSNLRLPAGDAPDEDSGVDAPSDVDLRLAELSAKIDKLTDLVVALQAQSELK